MIRFLEEKKLFILETENSSYLFGLNDKKIPLHIYYGDKLLYPEDMELEYAKDNERFEDWAGKHIYPQELTTHTLGVYDEDGLKVRFFDGVSDLLLQYAKHEINRDELILVLVDEAYSIEVRLHYKVYETYDLIERSTEVINYGKPLIIENIKSATIHPPIGGEYKVRTFSGSWSREYIPEDSPIISGRFSVEGRRGTGSGHQHAPFFAVSHLMENVNETQGKLWFGGLIYSGNFKFVFEKNQAGIVRISGGLNEYDTKISLQNGEKFQSPSLLIGYTNHGYGSMSEKLHSFEYDRLCPQEKMRKPFPVYCNTWGPYGFDVDEEKLLALVDVVKEIGGEVLLIDDGWFEGRNDETGGLGDWYPDKRKFPNGLKIISDKAHRNGLMFGLWVEPEMVSESSQLYKEHPEWALTYPTREKSQMRYQIVLNFTKEEVYRFAEETVDRIIEEYGVDYLKWDTNRYISETDCTQDFYLRYMANIERLYRHIQIKYPNVYVETSANGGARNDLGVLRYSDKINRSDNSDSIDVLKLHEGFTTLFLPRLSGGGGNIAASPHGMSGRIAPLKFRARLGMTTSISVGINLLKITDEEKQELKEYIAYYKKLRPMLHNSRFYRLSSAYENKCAVWQFVSKDKKQSCVFIFAHGLRWKEGLTHIKLRGLDPETVYKINEKEYHGDTLMQYGLAIARPVGDYYSDIIEINCVGK